MKRLPVVLALLAACSSSNPSTVPTPSGGGYDVVIENGRVVDGTGSAWFYGDIGIRGGRIATIVPRGLLAKATATERVNAAGLVVAPGFIDIQSHSRDAFLDGDGRVVGKITQGITTEIMGEAGTNAPQNQGTGIDPKHDFSGPRGFDKWLTAMKAHGVSPNIGSFVGASTVRMYAKGMAQGAATPAELDTMRAVVRNAMEDGAFGIGSALIYPPGNYASTEELIEINKASAPYGGVYITHMRSEADAWLQAIDEALRIGREGGVPVEIYHLKAGGQRNWHKTSTAIAKIDSARAAGQDVQADMYSYIAGGTGLSACLPPWASADGKLFSNLKDPATWAKIRAEMDRVQDEWEALCQLATPSGVLVLGLNKPENQKYAGKRLGEIAQAMGKDWEETVRDLLISEEQRIGTVYFMMSEDNVKTKLQQPWMKFGTDAGGSDPDSAKGLTHPRSYGNYPRILGKYVRDEKVMSLEDAIRKMSSAVATRLSIGDRGVLKNGLWADIVVFDPETIADKATFEKPHQLSVGMKYVFVNGVTVVRDGKHTGAKPGMIVRGPGYRAH
jgi:dihydroorotase/N-acyl-D-amino-acid deacylase